ncbi:MAG: (d)CMP kinase [Acidobacteria bacterium]|nr:(d)CMP kinase [Acidobacteriota bacterium]
MKPLIIAIDGPSGVGKSTLGRALAARLGCSFVESGAMYRAVGLKSIESGVASNDAVAVANLAEQIAIRFVETAAGMRVHLDGCDVTERIRAADVTDAASIVSTIPRVRELMVVHQRALGDSTHSVVMEGRDIGTVVFPSAHLKIYLDAAPDVRSTRRFNDGESVGQITKSEVQEQIEERDRRDRTRQASPLIPSDDAVHVDSSQLTAAEVLERVWSMVEAVAARKN